VNETQREFSVRYGSLNRVFRDFQLSAEVAPDQVPRLRQAARTLAVLRTRVERVEAPPEAATLRVRLLEFLRQQEAIANELLAVTLFVPKLGSAEKPLVAAGRRLRRGIEGASVEEQAVVVRRYAADLRAIARDLDELDPPALLAPSHDAYVKQLRAYAASSDALERGITAADQAAVDAAVRRMQAAAAAPPGTFRAQQAAIKAYNARVRRVSTLGAAVERERQRLEAEL
jgi:hypothetical protein